MALQWLILSYVVAAEVVIAVVLTLPYPMVVKKRVVSLVSLVLQPAASIVAFAAFQLCDIYWKNEHRLSCSSEVWTATERDRYEKSAECFVLSTRHKGMLFCALQEFFSTGKHHHLLSQSHTHIRSQCNFTDIYLLYMCIYRICKYNKDLELLEEAEKRHKGE
ncbi:hypothetical protein YC2023_093890 [Brassica napus]